MTRAAAALRVLHVVPAFYPATHWGGPIVSVHGLCNALAKLPDLELQVLATDAAGPALAQRLDVRSNPVRYEHGYDVFFSRRRFGASFAPRMLVELPRRIAQSDLVHLTAVYSPPTIPVLALSRLLNKPVVWSPRGAFQRWDASTRPRLKAAWDLVCRGVANRARTVLHATSEQEAIATRQRMPGLRVVVIPNGVDVPEIPRCRAWIPGGVLRLLYLGRLHPIKGLENLLRALASIDSVPYTLQICGTGEAGYVESLHGLVQSLAIQAHVSFAGEVGAGEKSAAFEAADVCVLPSHSENFGMVVAESLAHGVPVVAARGTPWAEVESRGCGLWVDNSPEALAEAVRKLRAMDLAAMGHAGRTWMADRFRWEGVARRMQDCYASLVAGA